jgi:hypothetical protein
VAREHLGRELLEQAGGREGGQPRRVDDGDVRGRSADGGQRELRVVGVPPRQDQLAHVAVRVLGIDVGQDPRQALAVAAAEQVPERHRLLAARERRPRRRDAERGGSHDRPADQNLAPRQAAPPPALLLHARTATRM